MGRKRYYKKNEFVWIKPLKKKGKVRKVNPQEITATVSYFDGNGNLVIDDFPLPEIDKLRKPRSRFKNSLPIKVKYFDDTLPKLEKIAVGDWIDLRTAEDVNLEKFDYYKIPLGVAMQLPKGFEAIVVPRSSTFEKHGVIQANSTGVIDSSFNGDSDQWLMPVIALRKTTIQKGTRIAQFKIQRVMPSIEFIEVDHLNNPSRGGFGSTGEN